MLDGGGTDLLPFEEESGDGSGTSPPPLNADQRHDEPVLDDRRFRMLVDAIVDYAVIMLDPDGFVVSWNEGARRQTGYDEREAVGQHVSMFYTHEDRRAGLPEGLLRMAAGRGRVERHLDRVRKDGTSFPADLILSAIRRASGALEGYASVTRDVSELRRSEEERLRLVERLHRSQRLESLGRLAGGIAHDFNNTLGAISNYAHLVSATVAEVASGHPGSQELGQALDDIGQIQRAVRKAAELTGRLLVLGRGEPSFEHVINVNTVIAEVTQLLRHTLGDNVVLDVELAGDLANSRIDPGLFEQVLLNLAINARDAMTDGGHLSVRTFNVPADSYPAWGPDIGVAPNVCVEVSDTGHGMSPETAGKVFDPFFTTKAAGEGTGLGLSVVHGIITDAGGRVHLYSEPEVGTTIKLFLPVVDAPVDVRDSDQQPASAPRGEGQTILVVDDQAAVRDPLARILERSGYQVLAASTPAEALDVVDRHEQQIDLLITDVLMPGMSGRQLSEQLTGRMPHLRTVLMSGFHATDPEANIDQQVLAKPFGLRQLLWRVHRALQT